MALTDVFVKNARHSGKAAGDKHSDGGGMYLLVKAAGKYWRMDYRYAGKRKTLALGTYPAVMLSEARKLRDHAKEVIKADGDPMADKRARKLHNEAAHENTFEAVAKMWHDQWRTGKAEHTINTKWKRLENDVFPHFGKLPIKAVTAPMVVTAVKAVNSRGARDVAERVLNLCSQVFRYAVAHSMADRNPATDIKPADILPAHTVKHHARVNEGQLPQLLRDVYAYRGRGEWQTSYAMQLMCLTFVRTSELVGTRWEEIDFDNARWVIPGSRMKKVQGRPMADHVVPLSRQAIEVLRKLHEMHGKREQVFFSQRSANRHMSKGTILTALYRMGYQGVMTGHGFRGVASTILHEKGFAHELIELQLSHLEKNKVSAAYNSAKYLKKRAELMQWWGDYVATCTSENIIQMGPRAA